MSEEARDLISGDDILEFVIKFSHDKKAVSDYYRMQKRIYELDLMKDEAEAALCTMPDKRSMLEATLENISKLRQTILKAFCEFNGNKFIATEYEGIDYYIDGVADEDNIKTFRDYYKQFCLYRYEFYRRSEAPDPVILEEYKTEAETLEGFINADNNGYKTFPLVTFTYKFNALKPYDVSVHELERFRSAVLAYMKSSYAISTHFNSQYHADVIRGDTGKMADRTNPSNVFNRWKRYMQAFDLKRKGGMTLAQIFEETKKFGKKTREASDDVNAGSAGRKDIIEALRLIESAAKGTFPN